MPDQIGSAARESCITKFKVWAKHDISFQPFNHTAATAFAALSVTKVSTLFMIFHSSVIRLSSSAMFSTVWSSVRLVVAKTADLRTHKFINEVTCNCYVPKSLTRHTKITGKCTVLYTAQLNFESFPDTLIPCWKHTSHYCPPTRKDIPVVKGIHKLLKPFIFNDRCWLNVNSNRIN